MGHCKQRIDLDENALACVVRAKSHATLDFSMMTAIPTNVATSVTDAHVGVATTAGSSAKAIPYVGTANVATSVTDAHVGVASKLDVAILHTQAKAALTGLGWKPAVARAAVAAAAAAIQGTELTLERLIFESLRRCPAPKA